MKTVKWLQNKTGNKALGSVHSVQTGELLRTNISFSHAKLVFEGRGYVVYKDHGKDG